MYLTLMMQHKSSWCIRGLTHDYAVCTTSTHDASIMGTNDASASRLLMLHHVNSRQTARMIRLQYFCIMNTHDGLWDYEYFSMLTPQHEYSWWVPTTRALAVPGAKMKVFGAVCGCLVFQVFRMGSLAPGWGGADWGGVGRGRRGWGDSFHWKWKITFNCISSFNWKWNNFQMLKFIHCFLGEGDPMWPNCHFMLSGRYWSHLQDFQ